MICRSDFKEFDTVNKLLPQYRGTVNSGSQVYGHETELKSHKISYTKTIHIKFRIFPQKNS